MPDIVRSTRTSPPSAKDTVRLARTAKPASKDTVRIDRLSAKTESNPQPGSSDGLEDFLQQQKPHVEPPQ